MESRSPDGVATARGGSDTRGMQPRGIEDAAVDAAAVAVPPERNKNPLDPPEDGAASSHVKMIDSIIQT